MTTTKNNRSLNASIISVVLIVASVVAMFIGLLSLFNIYQNNKTDGFSNGQITVTKCQEKDWAWHVYSCVGDYFSTGGGMIERSNVSVIAYAEYKQGGIIPDVYAPLYTSKQTTDHFVTGRERASVTYNIPWITLVVLGILFPIVTTVFILTNKMSRGKNG